MKQLLYIGKAYILILIVIRGIIFSLAGIVRGYREFQFGAFGCTASVSSLVYDRLLSLAFGVSILPVIPSSVSKKSSNNG